jgi:protein N-terminal glutamine amidohydrolase
MSNVPPSPILYQAFWCEENIWQLVQHPAAAANERLVLVIAGAEDQVACWKQKAGNDLDPVFWDYHVVLATRADDWRVWDLDSRLGLPVSARTWMQTTFPFPERVPRRFQPRFAAIPAEDYLQRFGSDRAHMRDVHGEWQQPPPPWTAIDGQGLRLADLIQQAKQGLDLVALAERLR